MSADKDARITELERKLAEQQHLLTVHAIYSGDSGLKSYLSNSGGSEELNNLLAKAKEEGRREAVPEGWQVVPKESDSAMEQAGINAISAADQIGVIPQFVSQVIDCWAAMLAAAPKPEGE